MRVARFLRDGFVLAILTGLVFVLVEVFCQPNVGTDKYIHVVVDRGMTFSQIAARFEQSGLVRNGLVFKALGRALRVDRRAKAGRYRFQPTASMASILRALYRGLTR
jgi:cell division protein YceG involved in septum cleavage